MGKTDARLAAALVISLSLHLSLAWLLAPRPAGFGPGAAKAVTLTVSLESKARDDASPPLATPLPAPPAPATVPPVAATAAGGGTLTQKARFLLDPDLSPLEGIPVLSSGSLSLRLHVSALGTVDRIAVMRSDPLPQALLDGLLERFRKAQLAPGLAGSQAVASTLDLVIHFEAGPTPAAHQP